jgi:hypothetical protein
MVGGGAKLPYDAEVAYLESTGTQWIDTGYRMTADDLSFEAEMMQKPSGNAADFFFGYRFTTAATSTGDMRAFFVFGTAASNVDNIGRVAIRYGMGSAETYSNNGLVMSQKGTVEYTPPNFVVNGVSNAVSTAASANPSYGNMYLFACNTTGWYSADATKFVGSIYNFRIWQGAVLVRDFQPVRITNSQGQTEGAMFDRANPNLGMNRDGTPRNDGLYLNRGTGSFVLPTTA